MTERNPLFDNFKAFLIVFVIFGHFFEKNQSMWGTDFVYCAWRCIYLFHMPGFAFVSGYFSKKNDDAVFSKVLSGQIIPLFVLHILYELLMYASTPNFKLYTLSLIPSPVLWYLLALAVWRISLQLLHPVRFILPISLILALLAGFENSIGDTLAISRTITLFPFFLAGNLFKERDLIRRMKSRRNPLLYMLAALALVLSLAYVWKTKLPLAVYSASCSYENMGLTWQSGCILRLVRLVLGFICVISIIILIPRRQTFISEIGRNSMSVYIFHLFILKVLFFRSFTFYNSLWFTFIGGCCISILIAFLLGRDAVSRAYGNVMQKIEAVIVRKG